MKLNLASVFLASFLSACQAAQPFWPVRHGDIINSDFKEVAGAEVLEPAWFFGPNIPIGTFAAVGSNNRLYTHSYNSDEWPEGPYQGCNLWALNASTGEVIWCSRDVKESLTSLALTPEEDIVVSDGTYLHAFSSKGRLKWRKGVDSETSSITITKAGDLLVADYAGVLRLYDAKSGGELATPFKLPAAPGKAGPFQSAQAPGLLMTGVAESYKDSLIDNFFGYGKVIQDMPLIHPETGIVYIAANGRTNAEGQLWAIKLSASNAGKESKFAVHCTAPMGPSSDTSPALSTDGRRVYVAASGKIHAFDAESCAEVWSVERPGFAASSPTVADDGNLYVMASPRIDAYHDGGDDARLLWTVHARDIAAEFGFSDAVFDSVILGTQDYLYVTLSAGVWAENYLIPTQHRLLTFSRADGRLLSHVVLGDESDSTISMNEAGWLFVPSKALSRGHALSVQILGGDEIETGQEPVMPPRTGIYAFRPAGN